MTPPDTYEKQIAQILRELGMTMDFGKRKPFREAAGLVSVGKDIYGRNQRLAPNAAAACHEMKIAAERDSVILQLVSAFRSVAHQRQIVEGKLAAGQTLEQILRVSAAPGFSEHHTGRAVDVTALDCQPLTEEFERTTAFAWLVRRASDFGFTMSYPRDNQLGVIYEPWHWAFRASAS